MKKIPLTFGLFALIDDGDHEKVASSDWYAHITTTKRGRKYYAMRRRDLLGIKRELMLHRFILGLQKRDTCRFIDGNSLNCQKSNLQVNRRSEQ